MVKAISKTDYGPLDVLIAIKLVKAYTKYSHNQYRVDLCYPYPANDDEEQTGGFAIISNNDQSVMSSLYDNLYDVVKETDIKGQDLLTWLLKDSNFWSDCLKQITPEIWEMFDFYSERNEIEYIPDETQYALERVVVHKYLFDTDENIPYTVSYCDNSYEMAQLVSVNIGVNITFDNDCWIDEICTESYTDNARKILGEYAYQYNMRNEFLTILWEENLWDNLPYAHEKEAAAVLFKEKYPMQYIWDRWMDTDVSYMETLTSFISETMYEVIKNK